MKVAVFSTKPYDRRFLGDANTAPHDLVFHEAKLTVDSAPLAAGAQAVCPFVNDDLGATVLERLAEGGTTLLALRSAGFNNVDLRAAAELGLTVARVPAYSPDSIAEHTLALILTLNRKIHRAYNRVREGNFALDGLLGFNLRGRTAGIVGTGKIGETVATILAGFGCRLLAYDPFVNPALLALGAEYVSWTELCESCDLITLHCPLTPETHHLVDAAAVARMKPGVMLVNTSRGGVIDTPAVVDGVKRGIIGNLALDVYEEEADLFFEDLSNRAIDDDTFARLLTFPNVLITGHQGFFTEEAMAAIAETTIANISAFEANGAPLHPVEADRIAPRPLRGPRKR
ncbi:2-hydroxyacid dehydrogenase [Consotaella aegiceratis]|uniref:2-hydroxyacid dehydrogenase n=1 Tax=Consotaella aegiceratis TaxID=3097961 RepID=UPI002F3F349A